MARNQKYLRRNEVTNKIHHDPPPFPPEKKKLLFDCRLKQTITMIKKYEFPPRKCNSTLLDTCHRGWFDMHFISQITEALAC